MRRHPTRAALVSLALLLVLVAAPAAAKYEIDLATRSFTPAPELLTKPEDAHVVIQFREIPSHERREELRALGITLLGYVPNYAWTASVRGGALAALDPGEVRAVFDLTPDDKIARTAIGRSIVRAFVYEDVEDALAILEAHGEVVGQDPHAYTLRLTGSLRDLASEDVVKYVTGPLPEKIENNDDIRDNINADEVQAAPYGLSGLGVAVGMWDNGAASTSHDDYQSRLSVGDGSSTGSHPTLVCGVMAGDGTRSTAYGGYPYQWRGVATEADIASYSWPDDVPNMNSEHSHAISNYDIVLSQNSWSWGLCNGGYCEYYGEYDDWSQNYDKIVRGSQGKRISVVFSAGNDGDCYNCESELPDFPYGTIPGPGSTAKNAIVVGSNDADTDDLSDYSSMGPTEDGRLKPDVAAPGCKSSSGITTTYTSNNYNSSYCGTSFSAPAVSGCVALIQEDYIDKFGGEAWPSTVKALLIQGADDRGNAGPDFQFGYGRVNIQNAIDVVRADDGSGDLIKEDTLSPSEVWEYNIDVTPGGDLKVTLVWDDYEADYGAPGRTLVNDLDLELEAPGGGTYYPWILDPNHPTWNATTGVDDRNNVEQVEVSSPSTGTWTIRVTASVMPEPNQDFSVVTNFGASGVDPPPAPPTGLGAVPGSDEGEIDLSWDPNSEPDMSHYRIERDDNPGFTSPASFTTDPPFYTDSGLTPGQTYWYRVFAVDVGGNESGPSNVASSDAQDLPPSAPTGLNASTGTDEGEIEIVWNPSPEPDVVQYRLERADNPGFSGSTSILRTVPFYTDTGLVPGEPYYYRVFAIDAGTNESPPSATDSATAQDLPPAAPTGLNAVTGTGEGEIDVTWNANSEPDFNHYRLERADNPGFAGATSFVTSNTSYDDSGLTPGDTYYYRVFAVDDHANESGPSNTDSAVAQDLPPSPPTMLNAITGVGEGEIDVHWTASPEPDVVQYRIERDTDPGFGTPDSFFDVASPFTDSGLIPGGTYYYRAFAIDAGTNESGPSNTDSAQAQDLDPSAPTGLTAVTGTGEGEIDVSWDLNPESDIDYYLLQRDYWPDFPDPVVFPVSEDAYVDVVPIPGALCYYRLSAVDLGGNESDFSSTVSATAQDLAPAAPTGVAADPGVGEGEIDVSWNASPEPDLDHYRLERDTDPGFGSPASMISPTNSYGDSGLFPGTTHYYRVFAVDVGANESGPSASAWAEATDLAPGVPTGLVAVTGADEGDIDVTWDANPELDIDHYILERDMDPAFPSPDTFVTSNTYYDDSGLFPNWTYYYRVKAVDLGGNVSGPSAYDSAQAQDLPPEPPTNLVAVTGTGDGEIDVSWDASPSPDVSIYQLHRAFDPGFTDPVVIQIDSVTWHTDSGLTPGQTYYYRAVAVDNHPYFSDPSNTDSAVAYDAPPAAPQTLECTPWFEDGEIGLTWDPSPEPDLDFYRLERDDNPGFTSPAEIILYVNDYVDEGLVPGAMYYYRVFAIDTAGNESEPSETCASPAADEFPAAPTGLVAVPGVADGEIDLDWDDNTEPDIDYYRVERADNPGFAGSDSFIAPDSDYADSGLVPGQTYYYRVFANDLTGHESDPSAVASAVATDAPPAAPTGLVAVPGPGEGEITLSWNANSEPDFDHYRLERCLAPDFGPGTDPFDLPEPAYHDSGLVPGTLYYYRVIAVDAGMNESPPSDVVSEVALDLVPTPPTGLTAVSGPGEGEIHLSWNANPEPDIDRYLLERATNPEFEPGSEPFETPATAYQDSGLVPGETYYYRVSAIDATEHTSDPSEVVSAVALDVAPAAPTGLTAAPSGDWDVLLTWDPNTEPDLDRYRLERDTTDVFGAGTVSFETTEESYLDSGLDVGLTYYYRLFAIDVLENESAPSDTVAHLFEGTDVPEELVASVSFVGPNPFSAEAAVAYTVPSDGASVTMSVFDVRGRHVRTLVDRNHAGGVYRAAWDGRDAAGHQVASGIYFFRIAVGDLERIRKVVLLR